MRQARREVLARPGAQDAVACLAVMAVVLLLRGHNPALFGTGELGAELGAPPIRPSLFPPRGRNGIFFFCSSS